MENAASAAKVILVVEDQNEAATFDAYMLRRAGYSSVRAVNGKEALEMLYQGLNPDLILLDVMMPEMGGFEFLKILREDDSLTALPVVMLTALDSAQDVMKAMRYGAVDYHTKPVDPDALIRTIDRLLDNNQ